MFFARQSRILLGASMLLGAALLLPDGVTAHHQWGKYHWFRTANPLNLDVGVNLDGGWATHLGTAITDWNRSTVLELRSVNGNADPASCPPTAGRIEVCNYNSGDNGWLGVAQIWVANRSHITQATARMNDFYFDLESYGTTAWRRLVMCQEIAHGFGLDHQDENFNNPNLGSCMDYTANPEGPPSNEHPNQHDYDELLSIYSHLDGASGGGGGGGGRGRGSVPPEIFPGPPQGVGRGLSDDHGQWGVRIRSNGRVALYELDLGNGHHVYTFVLFAS